MDSFAEQLLKRKLTTKIIIIKFIVVAITFGLGAVLAYILATLGMGGGQLTFLFLALVVLVLALVFGIKFSRALNIEYEYTFTNGTFDIDRISARTNRERLISADCKDIEEFGPYKAEEHQNKHYEKTVSAISAPGAENTYFAAVRQPSIGKVLVIIEPDERSLEHLKAFMPRNVLAEAKRRYGL